MKQLNGEPVMETCLVHSYELTLAETESILSAPDGEQESRVRELLDNRQPLPGTYYGTALTTLKDSYGRKLAEKRLREIKQLAAPPEPRAPLMVGEPF